MSSQLVQTPISMRREVLSSSQQFIIQSNILLLSSWEKASSQALIEGPSDHLPDLVKKMGHGLATTSPSSNSKLVADYIVDAICSPNPKAHQEAEATTQRGSEVIDPEL